VRIEENQEKREKRSPLTSLAEARGTSVNAVREKEKRNLKRRASPSVASSEQASPEKKRAGSLHTTKKTGGPSVRLNQEQIEGGGVGSKRISAEATVIGNEKGRGGAPSCPILRRRTGNTQPQRTEKEREKKHEEKNTSDLGQKPRVS